MPTTTGVTELGVLLHAGQVLASSVPVRRAVPDALALLAAHVGASGAAVSESGGRGTLATYGNRYVEGGHRFAIPLRAGEETYGELALWRDTSFELHEEQAAHVLADTLALALRADHLEQRDATTAIAAAEEERGALAAALHDDLLQAMVAARYAVDLAGRGNVAALEDLRGTLADAIVSARDVVWALHPRTATGDLTAALCALADRLEERGIGLRVAGRGVNGTQDPVQAALCYRLVQESASLAVRRLGATRIDLEVVRRPTGLRVRLTHNGVTSPGAPVDEAPLDRWVRRIERIGGRVCGRGGTDWLVAELPPGDGGRG